MLRFPVRINRSPQPAPRVLSTTNDESIGPIAPDACSICPRIRHHSGPLGLRGSLIAPYRVIMIGRGLQMANQYVEQRDGCYYVSGTRVSLDSVVYALMRSEEHTSELQSQSNLVCRLLLEKKKHATSLSSSVARYR